MGGRSEHLPLHPRGEYQAPAIGSILLPTVANILHLSGMGPPDMQVEIGDISSSPTARTLATTEGLGLGTYQVDDDLTEWSKGHTEGLERASVETAAYKDREQKQLWDFLPDAGYECPISETPREVRTRGRRWLGRRPSYVATETTQISLGVTHGYTTSFLMADILGSEEMTPREAVAAYLPEYASGYVLVSPNPQEDQWVLAGGFTAPKITPVALDI